MGVRTRGHDLAAYLRTNTADQAARDDAARVIERWNGALAAGRDIWWSPTIRAALVAGTPWLEVYCPGCQTIRALDIRTIDRASHGVDRKPRAGAQVLVVPGLGADAQDHWATCVAATAGRSGPFRSRLEGERMTARFLNLCPA
jgi:hypothetical protein